MNSMKDFDVFTLTNYIIKGDYEGEILRFELCTGHRLKDSTFEN
jgi:hypothetical protein